jgi:hypothetical protein
VGRLRRAGTGRSSASARVGAALRALRGTFPRCHRRRWGIGRPIVAGLAAGDRLSAAADRKHPTTRSWVVGLARAATTRKHSMGQAGGGATAGPHSCRAEECAPTWICFAVILLFALLTDSRRQASTDLRRNRAWRWGTRLSSRNRPIRCRLLRRAGRACSRWPGTRLNLPRTVCLRDSRSAREVFRRQLRRPPCSESSWHSRLCRESHSG